LFDALKKDQFVWTDKQEKAFRILKIMIEPPVLALPNFYLPFILEADACDYGIGAILMQQGKPISFMSKALGPRAAAWSTYDKEALAILEAFKKWKHYFSASSLVIRTDQQILRYIQEQKLTKGIQQKLLVKLLGYNYSLEYKKGKENKVADALSRVKHKLYEMFSSAAIPVWMTEVVKSYSEDVKCKELIEQLAMAPTALPNFTFSKGLLRYKQKIYVGSTAPLRKNIIDSTHNSELGGHSREKATYERIKLLFHWPGLKQQVVDFIKQCPTCQLNKPEHCKYPGVLQPLPVPDIAWTHISMDFVDGLPLSEKRM
jgi:hypothetical protein